MPARRRLLSVLGFHAGKQWTRQWLDRKTRGVEERNISSLLSPNSYLKEGVVFCPAKKIRII